MSLDRFIQAQARVWPAPLAEVTAGRKTGHWMWYIFPQLRGLGTSATALQYGIAGLAEAQAYLAHPVLGPRLVEISAAMLAHDGTAPEAILGTIDAMKLRSCMTLFQAAGDDPVFAEVLIKFYGGDACDATLRMIAED